MCSLLLVSAMTLWAGAPADPVTMESLLAEMTDLDRLTRLPDPAYTTKQFSSYDRRSKSPEDGEAWFANDDWDQYLRVEQRAGRREHVMMDAAGPGAILRIWSADPRGTLRIYLDGSETPAIEAPMRDLLGGSVAGFPKPIAGERSRGWNLYFPIPYARHAKVTMDEGNSFYHVNYRTYPAGTPVRSFAPDDLNRLADRIEAVARRLASPRASGAAPGGVARQDYDVTFFPGEDLPLWEGKGPRAICELTARLDANDVTEASRRLVLCMTFDGQQTVETPLSDFFGTAPGPAGYESLPLGITRDRQPEMWSHWQMPFARSAKLHVRNVGRWPARLQGTVATAPYTWDDRSLLFHAKWRTQADLPNRPFCDWTHLQCTGAGRFVGGALHIVNFSRPWWGEGDEKIYVDGETFPSTFGTGSEDYYGYAWCSDQKFEHAYHNQTRCDGPWNSGDTSVNRFHILDDIPFMKAFRFDMENWPGHDRSKTARSAISYWYARPGGTDFFKPIKPEDTVLIKTPPYRALRVPGAIEGETLKVISTTAGVAELQVIGEPEDFSCEKHLGWHEARPGDRLTVAFPSAAAGRRQVIVGLTRSPDNAKVQLLINGQKAGDVFDLYSVRMAPTGPVDLGPFDLREGENHLMVEIVGINEAAIKNYMFGLDYILLR